MFEISDDRTTCLGYCTNFQKADQDKLALGGSIPSRLGPNFSETNLIKIIILLVSLHQIGEYIDHFIYKTLETVKV